ncbi:MAG: hypothetical protein ABWZ40_13990 [Caulobacterales bacterium]
MGEARYQLPLRESLPSVLPAWMRRFEKVARKVEGRRADTYADQRVLEATLEDALAEPAGK